MAHVGEDKCNPQFFLPTLCSRSRSEAHVAGWFQTGLRSAVFAEAETAGNLNLYKGHTSRHTFRRAFGHTSGHTLHWILQGCSKSRPSSRLERARLCGPGQLPDLGPLALNAPLDDLDSRGGFFDEADACLLL